MSGDRLSHIGICVSDIERSLRFYCGGLAFREVGRLQVQGAEASTLLEIDDVQLQAVYLERDGIRIELLGYGHGHSGSARPAAMDRVGLTHLSFQVEDLGTTLDAVKRAGGRVLEDTRIDNPALGARAIFCTDPDGTRVELVETRPPAR